MGKLKRDTLHLDVFYFEIEQAMKLVSVLFYLWDWIPHKLLHFFIHQVKKCGFSHYTPLNMKSVGQSDEGKHSSLLSFSLLFLSTYAILAIRNILAVLLFCFIYFCPWPWGVHFIPFIIQSSNVPAQPGHISTYCCLMMC